VAVVKTETKPKAQAPKDFDFGAMFGDIVGGVVNSGGELLSGKLKADANKDVASSFENTARQMVDTINKGYDDQLSQIEQGTDVLNRINRRSFDEGSAVLDRGNDKYEQMLYGIPQTYANELNPEYDQNAREIRGLLSDYEGDLGQTEADVRGLVDQSVDQYGFEPYIENGARANEYLTNILGGDASDMTLSQQRTYDDQLAEMRARQASSNLRGAGRAGVAAVNEGASELAARFEDENRRRQDAAAQNLASTGYSATGAVANQQSQAMQTLQNARQSFGLKQADTALRTNQGLSDRDLNFDTELAKIRTGGIEKAGTNNLAATKDRANMIATMYQNEAANESPRYQARGTNAINKAGVTASAKQEIGATNRAADKNNTDAKAAILSSIYGKINDTIKKQTFPSSDASKPVETKKV
jgi:hypothetical protein